MARGGIAARGPAPSRSRPARGRAGGGCRTRRRGDRYAPRRVGRRRAMAHFGFTAGYRDRGRTAVRLTGRTGRRKRRSWQSRSASTLRAHRSQRQRCTKRSARGITHRRGQRSRRREHHAHLTRHDTAHGRLGEVRVTRFDARQRRSRARVRRTRPAKCLATRGLRDREHRPLHDKGGRAPEGRRKKGAVSAPGGSDVDATAHGVNHGEPKASHEVVSNVARPTASRRSRRCGTRASASPVA